MLALYPLLVYLLLKHASPRFAGLAAMAVVVLRFRVQGARFWRDLPWPQKTIALLVMSMGGLASLFNSELVLRLMPVAISLGLLLLFAWSLHHPPSMIERFARAMDPALPDVAVAYTRRVTIVWCGFFLFNAVCAGWTVFSSRELWLLYNGLLSYVLMGALFAAEWLCRRHMLARKEA